MSSDEFNQWTADLCRKFPAIAKWLEGLPDGGLGLLEEWAGVLERTDLRAALEVNRRILAGDEDGLPGMFPSDWQQLPAYVRRLAYRRELPEPGELNYAREERFDCPLCRDTGRVHVASPAAVVAVLADTFKTCHHRDAVARCTCRRGQALKRNYQWETFNDGADFRVLDPLWREGECERFTAWVHEQRDNGAEARAKANPNYEQSFAAFNKGSEF